jgi:hypothetical protein
MIFYLTLHKVEVRQAVGWLVLTLSGLYHQGIIII